jgi:hypothetical protein
MQIIANLLAYTFLLLILVLIILPYFLTTFEYSIDKVAGFLLITMRWSGFLRIRKHVRLSAIVSVSPARTIDLVPVVTGALPTLWGRPLSGRAVIIRFSGTRRHFPVVVTPPSVESFILELRSTQNLAKPGDRS